MKEKAVENQIKKCLSSMGKNVWYFKHAASPAMKKGIPDIIACIKGHFIGIEVKQANGRQSEEQKINEDNIVAAGGEYWLVFSYAEFVEIFNKFARRIKNEQTKRSNS